MRKINSSVATILLTMLVIFFGGCNSNSDSNEESYELVSECRYDSEKEQVIIIVHGCDDYQYLKKNCQIKFYDEFGNSLFNKDFNDTIVCIDGSFFEDYDSYSYKIVRIDGQECNVSYRTVTEIGNNRKVSNSGNGGEVKVSPIREPEFSYIKKFNKSTRKYDVTIKIADGRECQVYLDGELQNSYKINGIEPSDKHLYEVYVYDTVNQLKSEVKQLELKSVKANAPTKQQIQEACDKVANGVMPGSMLEQLNMMETKLSSPFHGCVTFQAALNYIYANEISVIVDDVKTDGCIVTIVSIKEKK